MTYRILVDENTSPRVVARLRERGHEAVHVTEALAAGVSDERILEHAMGRGAVVLTNDDDFLSLDTTRSVPILYYADDALGTSEIVARFVRVVEYVPDPADLPPVTNLGSWE